MAQNQSSLQPTELKGDRDDANQTGRPPVFIVALIAGAIGYILGCTQEQREQDVHAQESESAANVDEGQDSQQATGSEAGNKAEQAIAATGRSDAEPRGRKAAPIIDETEFAFHLRGVCCHGSRRTSRSSSSSLSSELLATYYDLLVPSDGGLPIR